MAKVVSVKAGLRKGKMVKAHTRTVANSASMKNSGKEFSGKKAIGSPFKDWDYDSAAKELMLTFHQGASYVYYGVPKSIEAKINSDPKAAMAHIRKTYVYAPDNDQASASFKSAQAKRKKGWKI